MNLIIFLQLVSSLRFTVGTALAPSKIFAIGSWGADESTRVMVSRAQQAGAEVNLAFPLPGGSNASVNQHHHGANHDR